MSNHNQPHDQVDPIDPDELTDQDLEYVVGGLNPQPEPPGILPPPVDDQA